MTTRDRRAPEEERIDQEAAAWFIRRDAGLDDNEQRAFEAWLAADRRHAERLARHERSWARFEGLEEHDLDPAIAPPAPTPVHHRPAVLWRQALARGGLAAAVALGWFAWSKWRAPGPVASHEYHAGTYENRILPDGTILELKGGTRLHVHFASHERRVRLSEGEAHFHVAKDPLRPFVVQADTMAVRAVGTAFNVRVTPQAIEVLVTEGTVRLIPAAAPEFSGHEREMTVSQRATLPRNPALPPAPPPVDSLSPDEIGELLAWKPAQLEFSGAPLGAVVTAFNKRNRVQIAIVSEELGRLPIDLSFKSDDVNAFLRLLQLTFDIRIERPEEDRILLSPGR